MEAKIREGKRGGIEFDEKRGRERRIEGRENRTQEGEGERCGNSGRPKE